MSTYFDPFTTLTAPCAWAADAARMRLRAEHNAETAAAELRKRSETEDFQAYSNEFIEASLVRR